jgi:hypothetical protein
VKGATTLAAGAANNITLNRANDFYTVAIASGKNVTLSDTTALDLGTSTISGNVVVNAASVSDSGKVTVAGTSAFATSNGPLVLDVSSSEYTGAVTFSTTGGGVAFINNVATILGGSTIGGGLALTSNGNVTQTGALSVTETTTISAGANDITLNNGANQFATIGANGRNVAISDANALDLGQSGISGTLTLAANGALTQSGSLSVGGSSTLSAGGANVKLDNAANDFVGAVTVTGAQDVTLRDGNALTTAINAGGDVDLTTGARLTVTSMNANSLTFTTTPNSGGAPGHLFQNVTTTSKDLIFNTVGDAADSTVDFVFTNASVGGPALPNFLSTGQVASGFYNGIAVTSTNLIAATNQASATITAVTAEIARQAGKGGADQTPAQQAFDSSPTRDNFAEDTFEQKYSVLGVGDEGRASFESLSYIQDGFWEGVLK